MSLPQPDNYEMYQSYNDLQEEGPLMSPNSSLLDQMREKMPDETVATYMKEETGQKHENFHDNTTAQLVSADEIDKAPVYFLETKPNLERSISLQKWRCVITSVNRQDSTFIAKLINLTQKGIDEEAEFYIEEISDGDKELIAEGAIFYWNIGYHYSHTGQQTRISHIRFRRLPTWTEEEIQKAKDEAADIKDSLGWK